MSDISFDFSGVNKLAADLGTIEARLIPNVRAAIEHTAVEIKADWREAAGKANPEHAKRYPAAIDYDMELDTDGVIGAEIGPSIERGQGAFGFLEESPGGVAAAPQGNARKALRGNMADFEKGLLKATENLL